jgi:hypothetical protein
VLIHMHVRLTTLSWYASSHGAAARDVKVSMSSPPQEVAEVQNASARRAVASVQLKNVRDKHSRLSSHH